MGPNHRLQDFDFLHGQKEHQHENWCIEAATVIQLSHAATLPSQYLRRQTRNEKLGHNMIKIACCKSQIEQQPCLPSTPNVTVLMSLPNHDADAKKIFVQVL